MSTTNKGNQKIGWKYYTPLEAEYLNSVISGIANQGLVTRPDITVNGIKVTISPFSLLICPSDIQNSDIRGDTNIVKITISEPVELTLTESNYRAIGFSYTFKNGSIAEKEWYGDFELLSQSDLSEYKGVIIATIQGDSTSGYSVTTQGSDISDVLLVRENRNPLCWISLISPRRSQSCDSIELRSHNNNFASQNTFIMTKTGKKFITSDLVLSCSSFKTRYISISIDKNSKLYVEESQSDPNSFTSTCSSELGIVDIQNLTGSLYNKIQVYPVIGTGLLSNNISGSDLSNRSVTYDKIAKGTITHEEIGSLEIYENNINDGAVTLKKMGSNSVDEENLCQDAVTTSKILNLNVTTDKIADSNVTSDKLSNNSVTTDKIADSNVTSVKLSNNSVTTDKIADSNVTSVKLSNNSVTNAKLSNNSVTTDKIADSNVNNNKIADSTIQWGKISDNLLNIIHPAGVVKYLGFESSQDDTSHRWLLCDGRPVSKESYPRLWNAIGDNFIGTHTKSDTTFYLPDLQGKFVRGVNSSHLLGTSESAQLPNIKGTLTKETYVSGGESNGTFTSEYVGDEGLLGATGTKSNVYSRDITFSASSSNSTYVDDGEVRPENVPLYAVITY